MDSGVTAPANGSATAISNEANRGATHFGVSGANADVFVVSPSGTHPDGFPSTGFCAWHDWNGKVAFTNMPYVLDAGSSCGANSVRNRLDGFSIVAGHLEDLVLLLERGLLGSAVDLGAEVVEVERLFDEVVCAFVKGLLAGRDVGVRGDEEEATGPAAGNDRPNGHLVDAVRELGESASGVYLHFAREVIAVVTGEPVVLDRAGLGELIDVLIRAGYRVIGPTVADDAIVLAELDSAECLPAGWGVTTAPGHYRLRRRDDEAVFGHSAGPQSWKRYPHPPRRKLFDASRDGEFSPAPQENTRYAFLGVRGCDLAAIAILDRVLGAGGHPDGSYRRRRREAFVVAVNCTEPGELCFCASMGTGPPRSL